MSLTLPSLLTFKSGGGKNAELKSPSPAFIKALARSMDSLWLIFIGSNDAASSRINGFSGCILPVWLQLALWALNDRGKGYVFLPKGWLFRGGYDAQVREYFIENELIDAVVQLPSKFFNHTGIAPALIILNKAKKKGTPVRFIDAEATQDDAGIDNILSAEHIADIVQLITTTATDDPRVTERYAPEIREQDMILAVNRYITPQTHIEEINFEAESAKLKQLENTYAEAKRQLRALLDN